MRVRAHWFGLELSASLLILCSGCGGPGRDVTLSPVADLTQVTADATAVWQDAVKSCSRSLGITPAQEDPDVWVRYGTTHGGAAEYQTHPDLSGQALILVKPGAAWDYADLVHMMAHELGHALGAVESTEPSDLMFRRSDGSWPVVTERDRKQVCDGW